MVGHGSAVAIAQCGWVRMPEGEGGLRSVLALS